MHIEILQRNLLRFSIDGSETERMVPMVFGSYTKAYFPEHSDYQMPTFEEGRDMNVPGDQPYTPWMIVQLNPDGGSRWGYAYTGPYAHWGRVSENDNNELVWMVFLFFDNPPHTIDSAHVHCGPMDELSEIYSTALADYSGAEPVCITYVNSGFRPEESRAYFMPIGNLGDRRFTAVSEDGWVMEGFRLMYD